MPTAKQKLLQDGKDLTLGILFLLDNAPDPPKEMEWHEYSAWAIAEHLKRHSYYYHPKGKRALATAAKMRSRILEMCALNTKPTIQKPGKEYKDKVAFVFAKGGTYVFRKDFLDRQGYDKDTFSESQLNKHVSEGDAPENPRTDGRPEGVMSEGISGSGASKTSSHNVGGQERREDEADAAAPSFIQSTFPSSSNHSGLPPPENSRTAPKSNIIDSRERREQNGTTSDEQPPPSRGEGRRLRSSVDPQTRTLITNSGTSCVNKQNNATPSDRTPRAHSEPILGAKRKPTQDHWPHKRQCQANNAIHQDNSSDRRPRSDSTAQAERPSKTPSTESESKNPSAPQYAVASKENQPKPQLAKLNLDQQGRNMKRLYSDIQGATDAVLSSIGRIRNTSSPLQPKPSGSLKTLYARCWGPRWEEVRVRQVDYHVFTTPQVMTSLLSAFLYDKVLTKGTRLEEIVSNLLDMGGSLGDALLEQFDVSSRGTAIYKRARMIEAQRACSKLAQDHETLQQQLKLEADSLAKDASAIISRHLYALSCSAKLFGLSSDCSQTDTLDVFESEFTKVIQKTLHYRLQLLATGCEYAFTWPSPDEMFNSRNMQIDGDRTENTGGGSIVLFTVFPGLGIKPMSSAEMESVPDAEAVVKVQWREDRF